MMRLHEILIVSICSALIGAWSFHNSWTIGIRESSVGMYYVAAFALTLVLNLPVMALMIWQRRFVLQNVKDFLHQPKQGEAYRVSTQSYVCLARIGNIVLSKKIGVGL